MSRRTKHANRVEAALDNGKPPEKVRPLNRHLEPCIQALNRAYNAAGLNNRVRLAILRMQQKLLAAYGPVNELCQEILKEEGAKMLAPGDDAWPAEIMEDEADVEVEPIPMEWVADADFGEDFGTLYSVGLIVDPDA